jgi:hypothetical protein
MLTRERIAFATLVEIFQPTAYRGIYFSRSQNIRAKDFKVHTAARHPRQMVATSRSAIVSQHENASTVRCSQNPELSSRLGVQIHQIPKTHQQNWAIRGNVNVCPGRQRQHEYPSPPDTLFAECLVL